MKKALKILLISLLSVLCVLTVVACNKAPADNNTQGDAGIIDYNGTYNQKHHDAFGYSPDLENVVIDGHLDEDIWTDPNKKWYTNYKIENPNFKFEVTTHMTDGGLYIAAKSNDKGIFYNGRNYFFSNTYVKLYFPLLSRMYQIDANGLPPTVDTVNIRSRYEGKLNANNGAEGFYVEGYITWQQLGLNSRPESVSMLPSYYWNTKPNTTGTVLPTTFVAGNGSAAQALNFNENGYMDADDDKATVGSHKYGLAKTNGWQVENPGEDNESVFAKNDLGKGYAKAIFFRDLRSNRFMLTTRVTVTGKQGTGRAGLLMYSDNVNYRAFAIELNDDTLIKNKLTSLPIRGYTNYPANITSTTVFANEPVSTEDGRKANQFDLTVFANAGNMYYLVNGKFVYSEEAIYIQDAFAGFYAYNADVEFTNYQAKAFADEKELKDEISKYVYTVEIKNENVANANASLSQIATANDGTGSIDVNVVFRAPRDYGNNNFKTYELTKFEYEVVETGEKVDLLADFKANAVAGHYTIKNIPGNIVITTGGAERKEAIELVTLKGGVYEKQTGDGISSVSIALYGSGAESRFNISSENLNYKIVDENGDPVLDKDGKEQYGSYGGYFSVRVPAGNTWTFDASKSGYRPIKGVKLNGGAVVDKNMGSDKDASVFDKYAMLSAVVGGTARSADDARYNAETGEYESAGNFTKSSAPGVYWDMSEEENGKVVFTSTNTGSSNIFYSGKTAAEYQVAYVELTNQTDYMAFQSIEDDPAVGFVISSSTNSVFCGLRQTGIRILPTSSWSDHIDINGLINPTWKGGIATIDRSDNGKVVGIPAMGNGSVNRVPLNGQTFTTSFLMIRRGGNVYLYASNGRAGLTEDSTADELLEKMEPFYHGYIEQAQGVAAIGFGITVSYNLRIDFENYWILAGQSAASKFADELISSELTVEGNENEIVDIRSDGLLSLDKKTGKGRIASDSSIVFTANNEIPEGKVLCVSVNGSNVYLSKKGEEGTFAMGAEKTDVNVKVSLIEAGRVSGTLASGGKPFAKVKGKIIDAENGNVVTTFVTDSEGKFSLMVEKNRKLVVNANINGYAMEDKTFTVSGSALSLGTLEFTKLIVGQKVGTFTTTNGMEYGIDNENYHGAYAHWVTSSQGDAGLTINPEYNNKTDFVLSFSYVRSSAAENGVANIKDEADLGFGIVMSGDDASYVQFLNIGTGYRFLRPSWGGRLEQRGVGRVNFAATSIPLDNYAQVKIIKKGGMLYMLSKYSTDSEYKLSVAHRMVNESGAPILAGQVAFAIKMTVTGGTYLNLTMFDIKVEEFNDSTASEIYANVTMQQTAGGTIAVEGKTEGSVRVENGGNVKVTVTPDAEKKVSALLVNGEKVSLGDYTGGVLETTVTANGNVTVTAEYAAVTYKTVVSGITLQQQSVKYVKVTDAKGISKIYKVVKLESAFTEETALLNTNDKTVTLLLPKGTYTVTMCKNVSGSDVIGNPFTGIEAK